MIRSFGDIVFRAQKVGRALRSVTAVPEDRHCEILASALAAGLILPLLVGDRRKLADLQAGTSLEGSDCIVIHEPDPARALALSIEFLKNGEADLLVQGGSDHRTLIDQVSSHAAGLMTGRLLSYLSVFELTGPGRLVLVTDTYLQDNPTLSEKQWILNNALSMASLLEIERPKVAVLAAIEQVNPAIPSTVDAAALDKMARRGQFGDLVLEGPLDIDCALDRKAAARKGVHSEVTGKADIFLVPEVDTGYSLAQMLMYVGKLPMAGVTMGTARPVVLDMPFLSKEGKMIEIALAVLAAARGGR